MYSEVLEFFVVSKDLWMLQVMQKMEPVEDCTYHFAMKPDVGEVCETLSGRKKEPRDGSLSGNRTENRPLTPNTNIYKIIC